MSNYSDIAAHMNAAELDVLDFIQGVSHRMQGNPNIRLYNKEMEDILAVPEFALNILKVARRHYAKGGKVGADVLDAGLLNKYRMAGRNGDNCLAIIGPRLKGLLDIMAEHKGTLNPTTGLPEYFSLGDMFSTIGKGLTMPFQLMTQIPSTLSHLASPLLHMGSAALPALGQVAGSALGARFGGPAGIGIGSQLGSTLGNLGSNIMGQMANQQPQSQLSQYAPAAGQHLAQMAQNMQGGMSPQEAAGNAMSGFGQNMGGGSMGSALQGIGNAMSSGQGLGGMFNAFQQSGAMPHIMNMARNAYQSMMGGGQQPQQQQAMGGGMPYGQMS